MYELSWQVTTTNNVLFFYFIFYFCKYATRKSKSEVWIRFKKNKALLEVIVVYCIKTAPTLTLILTRWSTRQNYAAKYFCYTMQYFLGGSVITLWKIRKRKHTTNTELQVISFMLTWQKAKEIQIEYEKQISTMV